MPETFIPQAARTRRDARPEDAEFEDLADAGAERDPAGSRRSRRGAPQKTRMSLLQRLANVGLGRRDEKTEPDRGPRLGPAMSPMPPLPERKPQRWSPSKSQPPEPYRNMQRRPAPQGWTLTVARHLLLAAPQGDDHFGHPAFCAAGQLKFVTILTRKRSRLSQPGPLFF